MMCSSSKSTRLAFKTVSALTLAISRAGAVFFLICAFAFYLVFLGAGDAFCSESVLQGQTPWIIDIETPLNRSHLGTLLGDIDDDLDFLEMIYNDLHQGDSQVYFDRGLLNNIYDIKRAVIGSRTSDYSDHGILDYLNDFSQNDFHMISLLSQVSNITNMYDSMRVFFASNQYEIVTGIDGINDALRTDAGNGEETVAEIVADIRDAMTNNTDFALGTAFTNLVSALAMYFIPAATNENKFSELIDSEGMEYAQYYGLSPFYYSQIFKGIPLGNGTFDTSYYPSSFNPPALLRARQRVMLQFASGQGSGSVSNVLDNTQYRYYDAYNTYQNYNLWTNFLTKANYATYTNYDEHTPQFALDWVDTYSTKFQNMLLQYANAESMTNENINVPEFARRWFETYNTLKMGMAGEYLTNNDLQQGTNTFDDLCDDLSDKDSYAAQKLPKWGLEGAEDGELDLGPISQKSDSDYKSEMDDIKSERLNNAEYVQTGLDMISDLKDEYSDFTLRLEGLVGQNDDSLQLRIVPFASDLVPVHEDYISFKMSQAVKDKMTWFWWVLDGIFRLGILSWSFFHLWGVLMGRDFIGGSK